MCWVSPKLIPEKPSRSAARPAAAAVPATCAPAVHTSAIARLLPTAPARRRRVVADGNGCQRAPDATVPPGHGRRHGIDADREALPPDAPGRRPRGGGGVLRPAVRPARLLPRLLAPLAPQRLPHGDRRLRDRAPPAARPRRGPAGHELVPLHGPLRPA